MGKVELLDCTLRDGGYVNNWEFGKETISNIFSRLVEANIEYIEIGFIDDRQVFNINRTIQPSTECFDKIFEGSNKKNSTIFAMIDYGTCDLKNIGKCKDSFIDGIRLIFKKDNCINAISYGKQLMEKGYKVSFQLVSITTYSKEELDVFAAEINKINPFGVSIVDSYGLLYSSKLLKYFEILDNNLNDAIKLGYHAHNNFQLGFSNSIELTKQKTKREIFVDGTVYGMGKSAGNAPLELLIEYFNSNLGKNYDVDCILEIIDSSILKIYAKKNWGYNILYYLAASNKCHPNYISYLLSKKTLSVKAINNIVKAVDEKDKLNYKKHIIESLYLNYQMETNEVIKYDDEIVELQKCKRVLLIGPGKKAKTEEYKVKSFLADGNIVKIAINYIPDNIELDFVLITNSKRYSMIYHSGKIKSFKGKIITTSNIALDDMKFEYVLKFENLLDNNEYIKDNALAMVLNLILKTEIENIYLFGFDGFSQKEVQNYCNEYLEIADDFDRLLIVNEALKTKIKEYNKKKNIKFVTSSLYEE